MARRLGGRPGGWSGGLVLGPLGGRVVGRLGGRAFGWCFDKMWKEFENLLRQLAQLLNF